MIGLDEAKIYLKVVHEEDDALILNLLATSQQLCESILRESRPSKVLETAILYGVAYLYEHREDANHKALNETLYHLLLAERKDVF